MTSFRAGDENGCVGQEIEIVFQFVENGVGVADKVSLGEDDDDSLARLDDLPSEGLVEFGMGLGGVDEQGADVGFFDCSERAEGGEFFNADFAFARFA